MKQIEVQTFQSHETIQPVQSLEVKSGDMIVCVREIEDDPSVFKPSIGDIRVIRGIKNDLIYWDSIKIKKTKPHTGASKLISSHQWMLT